MEKTKVSAHYSITICIYFLPEVAEIIEAAEIIGAAEIIEAAETIEDDEEVREMDQGEDNDPIALPKSDSEDNTEDNTEEDTEEQKTLMKLDMLEVLENTIDLAIDSVEKSYDPEDLENIEEEVEETAEATADTAGMADTSDTAEAATEVATSEVDTAEATSETAEATSDPAENVESILPEEETDSKDKSEVISLADVDSAPDIELEKNDSETVEVGSKDGSVENRPNISSSPTEELSAIPAPRGEENQTPSWSPAPRTPGAFRIPEYRWSAQHYRILTELLNELDEDLNAVHADPLLCTSLENQVLIHNILHLASQLADNLILATGGVLPVLASATSPSFELDVVEASQGLSLNNAWTLLDRIMIVVDLTLNLNQQQYPNVISINDIENEKAMQNGGILRQFLRLIAVTAVRNSLETRYSMGGTGRFFKCNEV